MLFKRSWACRLIAPAQIRSKHFGTEAFIRLSVHMRKPSDADFPHSKYTMMERLTVWTKFGWTAWSVQFRSIWLQTGCMLDHAQVKCGLDTLHDASYPALNQNAISVLYGYGQSFCGTIWFFHIAYSSCLEFKMNFNFQSLARVHFRTNITEQICLVADIFQSMYAHNILWNVLCVVGFVNSNTVVLQANLWSKNQEHDNSKNMQKKWSKAWHRNHACYSNKK